MRPVNPLRKRTKPIKKVYARSMRAHPAEGEKVLWEEIRAKKLGVKFRRQAIILGWIADFYSPSQRLVIEVDGPDHQRGLRKAQDIERDAAMTGLGLRILRISNTRVLNDMPSVLNEVRSVLVKE
jgi:very-short-patch-repair endonuclease